MPAKRALAAGADAHPLLSQRSPSAAQASKRQALQGEALDQHNAAFTSQLDAAEQLALDLLDPEAPRSAWATAGEYVVVAVLALTIIYMLVFSNSQADFATFRAKPKDWAVPRADTPGWFKLHDAYVALVDSARENEGLQLAFYGDSVFELWRGSSVGQRVDDPEEPTGVFERHFGQYRAEVLAISGDASAHLMWRLKHGESPAGLRTKVVVLQIGTHDLTYASFKGDAHILPAVNGTVGRVMQVVEFLLSEASDAEVVMLGLLPRGDHTQHPADHMWHQPSKFSPAVTAINQQLEAWAANRARVLFLDCGAPFVAEEADRLNTELFDADLKPNVAGLDALAACLAPVILKHAE